VGFGAHVAERHRTGWLFAHAETIPRTGRMFRRGCERCTDDDALPPAAWFGGLQQLAPESCVKGLRSLGGAEMENCKELIIVKG
jgi:hypothetical protein